MFSDVRYAFRLLLKNPAFSLVAALSLAWGIGANTAIFTLMDAVLLRDLPVRHPQELLLFGKGEWRGISDDLPNRATQLFSHPFYRDLREKNQVFSDVVAQQSFSTRAHVRVSGSSGEPVGIETLLVSGNYFSALGVNPLLGRVLAADDDAAPGSRPVAVLSYACWKHKFGQDPGILNRTMAMGETIFNIVGVAPPDFYGTEVGEYPDAWLPLSMQAQVTPGFNLLSEGQQQFMYMIGRLKPGVSPARASANVNLLFHQFFENLAGSAISAGNKAKLARSRIELVSASKGLSALRRHFSLSLQVLMAVVGLVLLIACANVANLLLARATARRKEVALRLAIGAGRGRMIRQFLTESLLLAGVGGGLGVMLALWGSGLLLKLVSDGPQAVPLRISPDPRMLGFTLAVSVMTGLLFGLAPALRITRLDLNSALREGKATANLGTRSRFGRVMVGGQVALSLLLLIGAGFFLRSLRNLEKIDTGFLRESVLMFRIDTDGSGYKEDARLLDLYQKVEQRLTSVPGVRAASFSMFGFNEGAWTTPITMSGGAQLSDRDREIHGNVVGPMHFEAMGLPLLAGRGFSPQDSGTAPRVAVVNQAWARHFSPRGSVIGERFTLDGSRHKADIQVVGVVKDSKYESVREKTPPMAYFPIAQRIQYLSDLEVRVSGDPAPLVPRLRQAIAEVDRNLPINDVTTMTEVVDRSLTREHLIARLSGFFGLLALALACVGLYGTMSYAVARRTNEIGIRMALGARRITVLWFVLREAIQLVAMGVGCGIPIALWAQRYIASLLFELKPADPAIIVSAAGLMALVAMLAAYLPAHRASRVDPTVALRYE
ncbi:MAG TPA: ABC transporter permease [Bryobacteraceae bacterium]|nr:ABC transporter permease [Bryobacteraceae bacterium]